MSQRQIILRIYLFFLVFFLATSIGRGFLSLWYVQNGFSYPQLATYFLIDFAIPVIVLIMVKSFSTTKSFLVALISEILLMINVSHFFHPLQIYLAGILAGTTVVFFYVTYNTLFFENTPQDKRAFSSSLYTLAGPVFNIFVPLLVGFISQRWGFPYVFLVSGLILFAALFYIRFLPKIEFHCRLLESLKQSNRVNFFLLIIGIREAVAFAGIAIFTLFFIRQPLPYGVYLAYLGFLSTGATVLLGFLSDKFKKRTIILYPVSLILAFNLIAIAFTQDLKTWTILSGALAFISTIAGTFETTLVLDKTQTVSGGMISREFLLGVGRIIGTVFILISLTLFDSLKMGLILIGLAYLLFPLSLWLKKTYQPV
ncbi:MFS transporter [Candidatus Shapirobacteria bacterium]|nr:MFS transporter [Candidatus Shapirobacteria bacterium]